MLFIARLVVRCVLCLAGVALAAELRVGDWVEKSEEVRENVKSWKMSRGKVLRS